MHVLTEVDRDRIAKLRAGDDFFWLDLQSPGEATLGQLAGLLSLEERTIRELSDEAGIPIVNDRVEDYVFLAYFGVTKDFGTIEVRMLISGSFIVTVHDERCTMLEELAERLGHLKHLGEGFVVYKVLDALTHSFFDALDAVDEEIDGIEDEVMRGANPEQLHRLVDVKNRLVRLRKVATAQRNVLARVEDDISNLPGLQASPHDFRDVYQRMISVSELIDSSRDVLTGAQDVYLSMVSNRLNSVAERLTLVATIFLPLTFLTGFFGQNFAWLVKHVDSFTAFAIWGIGGPVVCGLLILAVFRRAGYLGKRAAGG